MDEYDPYKDDIPSKHLETLGKIKGNRVLALVRYSWDSAEKVIADWNVPRSSVFSLTGGPLVVILESGLTIAFHSIPSLASVVVWVETGADTDSSRTPITKDEAFFPINATNNVYCLQSIRDLVGKRVVGIQVLKRIPENAKLAGVPHKVGVVLGFENRVELIMSHGLHDNSDDFSVILKKDISPGIAGQLREEIVI